MKGTNGSLRILALLAGLFLIGCDRTTESPSPREIQPILAARESLPPSVWNATSSIRILVTSSQGWTVFDETVPFSSGGIPVLRTPSDQAIRIDVQGKDSLGVVIWFGSKLIPASPGEARVDLRIDVEPRIPEPDGNYIGRTEPVVVQGMAAKGSDLLAPPSGGVVLECRTPSASIQYTLDGTWPSLESPVYTGPILARPPYRLRAIAYAARMMPSEAVSIWVGDRAQASLLLSSSSGTFLNDTFSVVFLDTIGEIRYTTDGSQPTWTSPRTESAIHVDRGMILRAAPFLGGERIGPEFRDTLEFSHDVRVLISSGVNSRGFTTSFGTFYPTIQGASLFYTRNGDEPGAQDSFTTQDGAKIELTSGMKYRAWREDLGWSPTSQVGRVVADSTPATFRYLSLIFQTAPFDVVAVRYADPGTYATYTIDGSWPTRSSPRFGESFSLLSLGAPQGSSIDLRIAVWSTETGTFVHYGKLTEPFLQRKGSMTDARDGRTYPTLLIGETAWMGQDLTYDTLDGVSSWASTKESSGLPGFRYYRRSLVVDSLPCPMPGSLCREIQVKSPVCPEGWRLPDSADWSQFYSFQDRSWFHGFSLGSAGFFDPDSGYRNPYSMDLLYWRAKGEIEFFRFDQGWGTNKPTRLDVDLPGMERNALRVRCLRDLR